MIQKGFINRGVLFLSALGAFLGNLPTPVLAQGTNEGESPLTAIEFETAPEVVEGPHGSQIEVRGKYAVVQFQYGDDAQLKQVQDWARDQIKSLNRENRQIKGNIVTIRGVPETEREAFYSNRAAYVTSSRVFSGNNTVGVQRLEQLKTTHPDRYKDWQEAETFAKGVAGEGTPFFIGHVPNPFWDKVEHWGFVLFRAAFVGKAVEYSVVNGHGQLFDKGLALGFLNGTMSGYLQHKFEGVNLWLAKSGLFRPNPKIDAGNLEMIFKMFLLSFSYYGITSAAEGVMGMDASFRSTLMGAFTSLGTEDPPAMLLAREIARRIENSPERSRRILIGSKVVQLVMSAVLTGLVVMKMNNDAKGVTGWTFEKIALYTLGGVTGGILLKNKMVEVFNTRIKIYFNGEKSVLDIPMDFVGGIGEFGLQVFRKLGEIFELVKAQVSRLLTSRGQTESLESGRRMTADELFGVGCAEAFRL